MTFFSKLHHCESRRLLITQTPIVELSKGDGERAAVNAYEPKVGQRRVIASDTRLACEKLFGQYFFICQTYFKR